MEDLAEIVAVFIAHLRGQLGIAAPAAPEQRFRLLHALRLHIAHHGVVGRFLKLAAQMPLAHIERGAYVLQRKVLAQVRGDPLAGAPRQIVLIAAKAAPRTATPAMRRQTPLCRLPPQPTPARPRAPLPPG